MKIILKPMGQLIVVGTIAVLAVTSLRAVSPRKVAAAETAPATITAPVAVQTPAFSVRFQGVQTGATTGALPDPWAANSWDASAVGEVFCDGAGGVGLRNISGAGATQLYNWKAIALLPEKTYRVVLDYRTEGNGQGVLLLRGTQKQRIVLTATGGKWQHVDSKISPESLDNNGLTMMLQNHAPGADNLLFVRSVRVTPDGDANNAAWTAF